MAEWLQIRASKPFSARHIAQRTELRGYLLSGTACNLPGMRLVHSLGRDEYVHAGRRPKVQK